MNDQAMTISASHEMKPREMTRDLVQMSEAAAFMSMIERAARDPNVDIDKLERLMVMKKELAAEAKKEAFNIAMAAVQAELPQVVRRAENSHTKSLYAPLEAIGDVIDPIITRHGFSMSFAEEACPKEGHYRTICDVANGGHERRYHIDLPIDGAGLKGNSNKTPTHAFKSTMTYSRRILTELIFNVKTKNMGDDDGNVAGGSVQDLPLITEKQVMIIRDLLQAKGRDEARFLKALGLQSLNVMFANKYDEAIAIINRVAAQAEGKK